MNYKIVKFIKKKWEAHRKDADVDGFPVCQVRAHKQTTYDRKTWMGSNESFIRCKREHDTTEVYCEYCDLCEALLKQIHEEDDGN